MISATPIKINTYNFKSGSFSASQQATDFKNQGNEYLQTNQLDKAIECYNQAIKASPDYTDAYFNLGKTYALKKDFKQSINAYEKAVQLDPQNTETITSLGEAYKNNGQYNQAISNFEKALKLDVNSDFARRNLEETKNIRYSVFYPEEALTAKKEQAKNNLNTAIAIAKKHLKPSYLKDMSDLTITFDATDAMSGRTNIAQYEHALRKITITDDYIWANPNIVSAYLVHEFVHAKDNDPYTSITEEQDAYEEAAKFWIKTLKTSKQQIKDPELDYVSELYTSSPDKLKARVAEIYKQRDPSITKTSPNHPPKNTINSTSLQDAASQPLKTYSVIA